MEQKEIWNKRWEHFNLSDNKKNDSWILNYLPENKDISILEIGCGIGNNVEILLNNNYKNILATDISETAINRLQEVYSTVNSKVMDITDINLTDKYDLIIADLCLHYFNINITKDIINNLYNLLNKDGKIIIRVNSKYEMNDEPIVREIDDNFYLTSSGITKMYFTDEILEDVLDKLNYSFRIVENYKYDNKIHLLYEICIEK